MKRACLIILILIIHNYLIDAQSDVTIIKKEFKTIKPGFNVAWNHIKDGDSFYSKGFSGYPKAFYEYSQAYKYNGENAELNYKLGVSSLYSDNKEKASEYLLKAYQMKSNVADDILLLTGLAMHYAGKFGEASEKLNDWLSSDIKKPEKSVTLANKRLEECKSALEITKDTLKIEIQNAGSNINSDADEYSEVLTSDGKKLFFASRRSLNPEKKSSSDDAKSDENILISENTDGKLGVAIPAGKNLMTEYCETPLFLDKTNEILYIYVGYEGEGDIKYSELKKGEWKPLRSEPFGINSSAPETSFCISPAGNEIAFVSDREKDGMGGKDIYLMRLDGKKWSGPVNAGETVNTKYNEESVRFSENGDTLWFSSAGHNTMGGFDIFYSVRKSEGGWSPAVNAGFPVNTQWDELFYHPSPVERSQFFFVSNRKGGFGGLDIYSGRYLPPPR